MSTRNTSGKLPIFQYLAMTTGTLNIVSSGMHYGWASPSLPKLLHSDSHIPVTSDQASWIAVMLLLGAISGSVLAAVLMDKIGRKNVVLLSSVPLFASWMMLAFAKSAHVLIGGRFVAGISDGLIFCSIPMYLGEIADPKIRGSFGSSVAVCWIFGMLLINIIGSYFSITAAALISSAVPVLLLLTFSWMPKSPYYLIMKRDFEQARRSLEVFKGTDDVEQEIKRISQAIEEQNANTGRCLDLFTVKSNRRALYIMMITRGTQQFSGTVAIMFYAQIIFKEAGNVISPSTGSIIYFGVQFVLSAFSSAIVDKTGRRPLMIISVIGSGLVLLTEGCYFCIQNSTNIDTTEFALVPVVALIVYVIIFSIGMQTIPILLLSEIFPTNVKAFALSFADIYYSVIATAVSKFFQTMKDGFGMHVPFFFFAAFCGLGLILIIFSMPETKGKTLEEIQQELRGDHLKKETELQEKFKKISNP